MHYFDHCASSPPREEVIETMMDVMRKAYANPSSLHAAGVEASKLIERSRALVAAQTGASNGSWIFTSGGTESNNLALQGAARSYRNRGNHIITTSIEHPSVIEPLKQLESEGFQITYLPVESTGHVSPDAVKQAITDKTILVSVMHVNNEIGTLQPIEDIARLLQSYSKILLHVDAVQSLGKLPIPLEEWGVDLLSGSAHKLRGPRGVGYLYVRRGVAIQPQISGGAHELGTRAGTENVPGIVASAKALRLACEGMDERSAVFGRLSAKLREEIASIPELKLTGGAPYAPHIVHFTYPGMKPEVIVHMLEQRGIIASTRSACSSKSDKPSRVLQAIGASHAEASGGIRISFGEEHRIEDIDMLAEVLRSIVIQLKPLERSRQH